ncbi:hypothetical protein KA183_01330 [bacterium]|nr:hypothetical protein [bacterium]
MKKIDEKSVQKLQNAGLFVAPPFPEGHVMEHGIDIGKPVETIGNRVEGFQTGYDDIKMDAPIMTFFSTGEKWVVFVQESIPGPGPGDFLNTWDTQDEAVADILDFFLGNPERMNAISDFKKNRKTNNEFQN